MKLLYTILKNDNFSNIKEVLKVKFEISDRLLLKLKQNNKIFLNGNISNVRSTVSENDIIEIVLDFEEECLNIIPTKMNLDIIYEDEYYLIINKPAGIPVHPSLNYYENSLSNGVKFYFDSIALKKKIRPVNRIDKNTSGLVLFAKNEYIQESLIKQMKNNCFHKEYIAICDGIFVEKSGTINLPIARKQDSIIERCIDTSGDVAITHYTILAEYNNISKVLCVLETGRTHQIRVHMSSIGHPIIGDTLYGYESKLVDRQALHSFRMSFMHPITKELVNYIAELPHDINSIIFN